MRLAADRRRRPLLTLEETVFRELIGAPGLKPRFGGGWIAQAYAPATPPLGRPGLIEGERTVMEARGRRRARATNLGESPIAWLARRRGTRRPASGCARTSTAPEPYAA